MANRPNTAQIKADLRRSRRSGNAMRGLRIAIVRRVDYEAMRVDLLAVGQGNDTEYTNVPLTFPAAGRRNFMGVMPEVNDNCIIGFAIKEGGEFKQPYILAWIVPGALSGYNWMTTATASPQDVAMDPATKFKLEGVFGQVRHKLRHLVGGNAVVSSSQGSDLVLDESALITNRRGNEVLLRDQDQALVVRTLQQFHAGAGFRIYGGIVQRDAQTLIRQMVSDGKNWTGPKQFDRDGNPIPAISLPKGSASGTVTPADVFSNTDLEFDENYDPYSLLQRATISGANNQVLPGSVLPLVSDTVAGGKPIVRLGLVTNEGDVGLSGNNTAVRSLTEYRIEVAHTTDGTLPVTEQTDGFDVDRTPDGTTLGGSPTPPASSNAAFVEFVLGTAVENDLLSPLYGQPLTSQIFFDGQLSPSIFSTVGSIPVSDQLAVFLRVKDPTSTTGAQSFLSLAKGGFLRGAFAGTELLFQQGVNIATTGEFTVSPTSTFSCVNREGRPTDNVGIELKSQGGAVVISAGASTTEGREIAARTGTEGSLPALILNSQTNTLMQAQQQVQISAPNISLQDASQVQVSASSAVNISTNGAIVETAKTFSITSLGRAEYTYGGPKDSQPTNAPLRLTKFTATPATGFPGGTADEYAIQFGDLVETIETGSRKTNVTTGDILFETYNGTIEMKSFLNTVTLEKDSIEVTAKWGEVTIEASTNAMTLLATRNLLLKSRKGVEINAPSISLEVIGADFPGGVLTDGCIDGLTGKPLRSGGTFGSKRVRMSAATP